MLPQFSLLSHFQGCLLGLVVGSQWSHPPAATPPLADGEVCPGDWSEIAIDLLQTLTRSHQWQSPAVTVNRLSPVPVPHRQVSGLAIATLPLALYFHDDLPRQQHLLQEVSTDLGLDAVSQTWLLGFAYVIAQAVKGQREPDRLIPQTLAYLRLHTPDPASLAAVNTTLTAISTAQAEAYSLTQLLTTGLEPTPAIAIALTCFLQTPTDLRLALSRATRWSLAQPQQQDAATIPALTGALIGAYATVAGLPPSTLLATPVVPRVPTLIALADELLASWSGLYAGGAIAQPLPVAAPWVMRPSTSSHRK